MREAMLQSVLGDLIRTGSAAAFRRDPAGFGADRGLSSRDAASFLRQADRFLLYRELARTNLVAPLENTYPVLQALLGPDAWAEATAAFLAGSLLASPFYRDIAPAFAAWLADTGWGRDRWPALLELAHYECTELLVTRWPDAAMPVGLAVHPTRTSRLVLDPAARVVSYGHAVHRATEAEPLPVAEPTHLLLHRDPEGGFAVIELTGATAALLAADAPLGATLGDLDLRLDGTLLELFSDLRARGALLGFTS